MTGLQMQTYVVISGFTRRRNIKGLEYGMPVSIPVTPESLWGYETVTAAYDERPAESRERIVKQLKKIYPHAEDRQIKKMIGGV